MFTGLLIFYIENHFLDKNRSLGWIPDVQTQSYYVIFFMSYVSFDIICHLCHMTVMTSTIWHESIKSILVSKWASEPQESSQGIRFCLKNYIKWKKMNNPLKIVFLYRFLKSFVFLAEMAIQVLIVSLYIVPAS